MNAKKLLLGITFSVIGLMAADPALARQKGMTKLRDDEVTTAIQNALRYDNVVPSDNVQVTTSNGDVTLDGTVPDLLARVQAEQLAKNIIGVRSVKNDIKIVPLLRNDSEIAADVKSALALDPAADLQHVDVKVAGGNVHLTGTVASAIEKERGRQLAMNVPGVMGVTDDLAISSKAKRTDSEISADIRDMLRTNGAFRETALSTQVKNGKVSFSGVVLTVAQRDDLAKDAWLSGVRGVDVSGVTVDPWAAPPGEPLKVGASPSPSPSASAK